MLDGGPVVAPLGELDVAGPLVNGVAELVNGADILALLLPGGVVELVDEGEVVPVLPADPDVEFVSVGNTLVLLGELEELVMLDELDVELVGIAELQIPELARTNRTSSLHM